MGSSAVELRVRGGGSPEGCQLADGGPETQHQLFPAWIGYCSFTARENKLLCGGTETQSPLRQSYYRLYR